jgi:hypothetical protein
VHSVVVLEELGILTVGHANGKVSRLLDFNGAWFEDITAAQVVLEELGILAVGMQMARTQSVG